MKSGLYAGLVEARLRDPSAFGKAMLELVAGEG